MDEISLNTMLEDLILNIEETVKRAKENLAGVVNKYYDRNILAAWEIYCGVRAERQY